MKWQVVIALMVVVAVACEEKYTTKYDNLNLDEILGNETLLINYCKCLLDEGRCSPEGKELKANMPDAMQNGCKKCSEKQKCGAKKVINFLRENKHECWAKLKVKYDPNNEYEKTYEGFLTEKLENC